MSDLIVNKSMNTKGQLTQYAITDGPSEPPKKPPGTYICTECGDTQITWRTPVDEFKTRCPKCGVQMTRLISPLS